MAETSPVLSICIPTFNRAPFLEQTLASICAQAAFVEGEQIEVVISDNFSDDETQAVGQRYAAAFPGKVRYHRNAEPVQADKNFDIVMHLGRGDYLKLHNDNLLINNGSLAEMLRVVQATAAERPVIFFTNGNMNQGNPIEVLNNINDFVRRVSFFCTWIGGFGMWREEFLAMTDFGRHTSLRLVQTDVLLRLMAMGKRAIVLYQPYFTGLNIGKKGGYNIAEVFGQNYLWLLKLYLAPGLLDDAVFQAEKKSVLVNHIIPYYFDKDNGFQKTGFFPFMQDYLHDPYFYQAVEHLIDVAPAQAAAAPVVVAPQPSAQEQHQAQMSAHWRALNPHNEISLTRCYGPFDFNRVTAGRKSYGGLTVWTFGCGDEGLRIGNFVSIADDVKFLLGGNHHYEGFSTFPFMAKYFGTAESGTKGPIVIGDDVWIGYNTTILSGVSIGQGAIVAAGSLVTRDVAPYSIVGGNPAKLIKHRFAPEVIEKMSKLDFSKLDDQAILRNREILYQPLTPDNVDAILARLTG